MNIDSTEKYLYEIIESYKECVSDEEKNSVFNTFCSSLWDSTNKRRTYIKKIKFKIRQDILPTDIGQVFDVWSEVEYKGYKAMTKETDWCSLIRQKINNLYTRYFDGDVILNADYMNLLHTPKRLYFQLLDGVEMDADELTIIIDDAMDEARKLKNLYQKQKMDLSWHAYKEVIEVFLRKIFDNCQLVEDYERERGTRNNLSIYSFANEDNMYIRYFCKSLEKYMSNYQKDYYGLKRGRHKKYKRCKMCGAMIENTGNKKMYCGVCAKIRKKNSNMVSDKKYKNRVRENRKL